MEKWTYDAHQQAGDETKNKDDDKLISYKPDESDHQGTEPVCQGDSGDFTEGRENAAESLMSRKDIEEALDQILGDVKHKRENDLRILSDVKKEVMAQAAHSCDMLEQHMNHMHQIRSKELDKQIVELMNALSKSQKLEEELHTSKASLRLLYKDISETEAPLWCFNGNDPNDKVASLAHGIQESPVD